MTEKHYCGQCVYFTRFYCPKINKQVSYSGYTCDDFELKGERMTEKRFINDVSEILDTYFGYMGTKEPSEREIKEKDYLLIGVARSQRDAESICEKLNEQNEELIEYCNFSLHDLLDKKNKEIEQLKSELSRYKELNRLDIWKSSYSSEDALITELQDKCDKKQEHIVLLENKIHRMREAIHKLEWLASHRNADLIRENEQLKKEYNLANRFHSLDKSKYDAVVKENEQLRNQMSISDDTINDLISEIEQLKSELRIKIVK